MITHSSLSSYSPAGESSPLLSELGFVSAVETPFFKRAMTSLTESPISGCDLSSNSAKHTHAYVSRLQRLINKYSVIAVT